MRPGRFRRKVVVESSSDLSPKFQEYVCSGPLPEASQASSRLVACIRPCEDPFKELIIKEETSSWSLLYRTQTVWEKMLSVTGARVSKEPEIRCPSPLFSFLS